MDVDTLVYNVTVGRKKRKRRPGAGTAVRITPHYRTPRGPNAGKRRVRVDAYRRGKPPKGQKGRTRTRRRGGSRKRGRK